MSLFVAPALFVNEKKHKLTNIIETATINNLYWLIRLFVLLSEIYELSNILFFANIHNPHAEIKKDNKINTTKGSPVNAVLVFLVKLPSDQGFLSGFISGLGLTLLFTTTFVDFSGILESSAFACIVHKENIETKEKKQVITSINFIVFLISNFI